MGEQEKPTGGLLGNLPKPPERRGLLGSLPKPQEQQGLLGPSPETPRPPAEPLRRPVLGLDDVKPESKDGDAS